MDWVCSFPGLGRESMFPLLRVGQAGRQAGLHRNSSYINQCRSGPLSHYATPSYIVQACKTFLWRFQISFKKRRSFFFFFLRLNSLYYVHIDVGFVSKKVDEVRATEYIKYSVLSAEIAAIRSTDIGFFLPKETQADFALAVWSGLWLRDSGKWAVLLSLYKYWRLCLVEVELRFENLRQMTFSWHV